MTTQNTQLQIFDTDDFIYERIRQQMLNKTCRTCAHRYQNPETLKRSYVCDAIANGRTTTGCLKVRNEQPACIRYTAKQPKNQ
ncbi:MAG: hypothetical protein J5651_00365 [Salinivirgaceae bacterium]|nr:hypothetical protein [Salinivirgaceae bacterium]